MKKLLIFISVIFFFPFSVSMTTSSNKVFEITCEDNIYLIDEHQEDMDDLLIEDALIFSSSSREFNLNKSFRLKKDQRSDNLTWAFEFNENVNNSAFYISNFSIYSLKEKEIFTYQNSYINSGYTYTSNNITLRFKKEDNFLFITLDLSLSQEDYFLFLAKDNYLPFKIKILGNKNLFPNYQKLYFGLPVDYPNITSNISIKDQINLNGDTFEYTSDLSDKESLDSIIKKLSVKEEIVILEDHYTPKVDSNSLGECVVELALKEDNTPFHLKINLVDKTPPTINSTSTISVSYKELDDGGNLDLSKYYYGYDVVDGKVEVTNKLVKPTLYTTSEQKVVLSDKSGNTATYIVKVNIIDDVKPIITSEKEINVYRYSTSTKIIISSLNIIDEGSGVKEVKIIEDEFSSHRNDIGTFNIKLLIKDNYNNKTYETIKVNVLDKIGPINYLALEDINLDAPSEESILTSLKENNSINNEYTDYYFITPVADMTSSSNLVQLALYNQDGEANYYSFTLNSKKEDGSSFSFSIMMNSIFSFFKNIYNFFSLVFENLKNLFSF